MLDSEVTFAQTNGQSNAITPYTVTTPASLSAFTADRKMGLIVSGGTVTLLRFLRGGVYVTLPIISGILELNLGDSVEFTYVVAPTLTVIPR